MFWGERSEKDLQALRKKLEEVRVRVLDGGHWGGAVDIEN